MFGLKSEFEGRDISNKNTMIVNKIAVPDKVKENIKSSVSLSGLLPSHPRRKPSRG